MEAFLQQNSWAVPLFTILVLAWTLPWKGVALWKAARLGHKVWFVALLVVNTLAILEIIYIFAVARGKCCSVIKAEEKLPMKK